MKINSVVNSYFNKANLLPQKNLKNFSKANFAGNPEQKNDAFGSKPLSCVSAINFCGRQPSNLVRVKNECKELLASQVNLDVQDNSELARSPRFTNKEIAKMLASVNEDNAKSLGILVGKIDTKYFKKYDDFTFDNLFKEKMKELGEEDYDANHEKVYHSLMDKRHIPRYNADDISKIMGSITKDNAKYLETFVNATYAEGVKPLFSAEEIADIFGKINKGNAKYLEILLNDSKADQVNTDLRFNFEEFSNLLDSINEDNVQYLPALLNATEAPYGNLHRFNGIEISLMLNGVNKENAQYLDELINEKYEDGKHSKYTGYEIAKLLKQSANDKA